MNLGYIINSDRKWFDRFKIEVSASEWIVHFQMSGRQPAKVVDESTYLFHRVGKTNKILGYSRINEISYLSLDSAINKFGIEKLGYNSREELIDTVLIL